MLKHAASVCLIAALVSGGAILGYRNGLATASQMGERSEQPVAPTVAAADPAIAAIALMQSAAAPPCTLDSVPRIALFEVADVATQHLFIIGSQPIPKEDFNSPGKFNFNIGYQF